MRVNRRFLYAGVFLLAIGATVVAADLGAVTTTALTDALRLWPLALVAVGVGLVLRRNRASLAAGVLAAAIPGLVLGSGFAVAPRVAFDCGAPDQPAVVMTERGRFDGTATVSVHGGCGSLDVRTAAGAEWSFEAANTEGEAPMIRSTGRALTVEPEGDDERWSFLHGGRDAWDLTLPTSEIEDLSLAVTMGDGDVVLPGATIGRLRVTANAARVWLDLSEASLSSLDGVVNAGQLSIALPARADLAGSLRVGAGKLQVCAPDELGLRITMRETAGHVEVAGRRQDGPEWQSGGYTTAAYRADLSVVATFGELEINPIGGCR